MARSDRVVAAQLLLDSLPLLAGHLESAASGPHMTEAAQTSWVSAKRRERILAAAQDRLQSFAGELARTAKVEPIPRVAPAPDARG